MSDSVPVGWSKIVFDEIADIRRGITYVASELVDEASGQPLYVNMKSFKKDGGYNIEGEKYFGADFKERDLASSSDLFIANTDVTPACDIIGAPALVPDHRWARKVLYSHHVSRLAVKDATSNRYLYYLLMTPEARYFMKSIGRGTTVKMLDADALKKYEVVLPPLPEQQKIAAILSSVDDVIEKTRAQVDKLKDLKTGMMQELLTKGIGAGGVPHTEFKDSPVGRIPVSWNVTRLGDVTQKFQNGYAFKASGYVDKGIPIISMASIGLDGNFNAGYSKTKHWDAGELHALERYIVQDGDLLIAMTDVTPTMELIGRCCIAQISQPHLLNQRVGLIRLDSSRVNKHFVAYYSNHEIWRDYARGMSGLGAQANLGTPQIANGIIPLPPLEEQEQIASILQSIDKIIKVKEEKVSKGQAAKKALMQDLLTGKVRVKIDQKGSAVA